MPEVIKQVFRLATSPLRVIAWECGIKLQNWHKLEMLSFMWEY
jgi:hypothetical protein